jgi:heme/copper-type cytochrome/quinol oxidase subunit 2
VPKVARQAASHSWHLGAHRLQWRAVGGVATQPQAPRQQPLRVAQHREQRHGIVVAAAVVVVVVVVVVIVVVDCRRRRRRLLTRRANNA